MDARRVLATMDGQGTMALAWGSCRRGQIAGQEYLGLRWMTDNPE
jgi:hypothetical protein